MITNDDDRIIHTGLYTNKAKEVLSSVFGQLSDGWGENNPRNDRWWKFADAMQEVDGEVTIHISAKTGEREYHGKWIENGFAHMHDLEIKQWMARMVKKTIQMELKDESISNGWRRDNTEFETRYLNYHETITVAEVYCIYELLLGRNVGVTKYDVSVIASVQGSKRQPEEIEAETKKREAAHQIESEYAEHVKELNAEEKKTVDELNAKIAEIKQMYCDKRNAAWHEKQKKLEAIA